MRKRGFLWAAEWIVFGHTEDDMAGAHRCSESFRGAIRLPVVRVFQDIRTNGMTGIQDGIPVRMRQVGGKKGAFPCV